MIELIVKILSGGTLLLIQCCLFLIFNILDGYTTWLVLCPDHFDRERNPVARWVFKKLRPPVSILFFKVLILAFLGDFIAYWHLEALTINIALLAGNLLFIYVVPHNYHVYKKYQKMDKLMADLHEVHWVVQ